MTVPADEPLDDLLRALAPEVLAALVRRSGDFDGAEDAVQEALIAATRQWPAGGVPDNPRNWLIAVAGRRQTDQWRSDSARRRREAHAAGLEPSDATVAAPADRPGEPIDDTLALLFLCCDPALTEAGRIALTLRAVGGLTTAQIAQAFLAQESAVARRISRAKQQITSAVATTETLRQNGARQRLDVVLEVLYLIFNEGYTSSDGDELQRVDLAREAIRLTRQVHLLRPGDGEVTGLLALMLLIDSRRDARTDGTGAPVLLPEQDRARWDAAQIEEGVALLTEALPRSQVGPYQVQAAIAALHAEAVDPGTTDWPQILALYDLLTELAPGPMVSLNRAVAVAMVRGPLAGLDELAPLVDDDRISGHHRLLAVRAHLLELTGDRAGAATLFRQAAGRTRNRAERRHLTERAAQLGD